MRKRYYARRRKVRRTAKARFFIIIAALAVALAVGIYLIIKAVNERPGTGESPSVNVSQSAPDASSIPSESPTATEAPTPTPEPSLAADLKPAAITGKTDPATFSFETDIMNNGQDVESYQRDAEISFGAGNEYTALEGITTFRGNNYRDMPSWGTATISEETLSLTLTKETSRIGKWGGSGWTGQPLIVKWPAELRAKMTTLYDAFKAKEDFTEVIVCSLDGRIYFMDLETGEKTRDYIVIGAPTKGTASLDPRGWPILYVGQGLQSDGNANKCADMYFRAFSLIDGKKIMQCGASSADPFAHRYWQAYDSSPLIDAETDTLIWPGENGVIYTCKLNSSYNAETGEVKMDYDPAKVKYRYTSTANKTRETELGGRWGIEDSAVAWRNYLIFTDNAGMLQCLDINTMSLVYANDLGNDSDVSMVLEEVPEEQKINLYTACEYDDDVVNVEPGQGKCWAYKIDGLTGDILWKVEFTVDSSDKNVDGGILASPILGQEGTTMEGLVIYNVTKMIKGESNTSALVAIDKESGTVVWTYDMGVAGWSCSSPVPVYSTSTNAEGKTIGYIVQCEIGGTVALIRVEGNVENGYTEVNKLNVNTGEDEKITNNFEATPAVYGNTIVVGSRDDHIFFITIK